MNKCPSHVDPDYYAAKYGLLFRNNMEATAHYIKEGKEKGYFPNRDMEIFYCQTINFDPEYYKRKYCLPGNNKEAQRHWKLYGAGNGNYANQCEETGEHVPFMCKCKIKNKTINKRNNNSEHGSQVTDSDEVTESAQESDRDKYIFSESKYKNISNKQKDKNKYKHTDGKEHNDKLSTKSSCSCKSACSCDENPTTKAKDGSNIPEPLSWKPTSPIQDEPMISGSNDCKVKKHPDSHNNNNESEHGSSHGSNYSCSCSCFVKNDTSSDNCSNHAHSSANKTNLIFATRSSEYGGTDGVLGIDEQAPNKKLECQHKKVHADNNDCHLNDGTNMNTKPINNTNSLHDARKSFLSKKRMPVQSNQTNTPAVPSLTAGVLSLTAGVPSLTAGVPSLIAGVPSLASRELKVPAGSQGHRPMDPGTSCNQNGNLTLEMTLDSDTFEKYFVDDNYCVTAVPELTAPCPGSNDSESVACHGNDNLSNDNRSNDKPENDNRVPDNNPVLVMIQDTVSGCASGSTGENDQSHSETQTPETPWSNDTESKLIDAPQILQNFQSQRDSIDNCNLRDTGSQCPDKQTSTLGYRDPSPGTVGYQDASPGTQKYIFENQMNIVCQNIINIKKYLNMCHIHIDTYIVLLKQAYQCLVDICNPCNDYMAYNAARIKLCNMLKEAEKITKSSRYNDLPIFYGKTTSSIKFPVSIHTNDPLLRNSGNDHTYFKIRLMNVSLQCLGLDKYCHRVLNKGETITNFTSPVPPADCPVGKTPNRTMYSEPELIKCWDMNYHLKKFEAALYRVSMAKEILCDYLKVIEIKEEFYHKIKIANQTTD
jgi:hypothetical protein